MTKLRLFSLFLICTSFLLCSVVAVSAVTSAVIGETVHLSGEGGGYDEMYLFLTGPNLSPGGVRLDSITRPVVSGNPASFSRAPVRDGIWEYVWNTGRTGGTLDPGTYLIWVVSAPLNRYDLGDSSYATQTILLTNPVLTAEISGDKEGFSDISPDATSPQESGGAVDNITSVMNTVPYETEKILKDADGGQDGAERSHETEMPPTTAGSVYSLLICNIGVITALFLRSGGKVRK